MAPLIANMPIGGVKFGASLSWGPASQGYFFAMALATWMILKLAQPVWAQLDLTRLLAEPTKPGVWRP